jgi:hypothetical protein
MSSPERHDVPLASEDIGLIIEALDSHEFWQLSESHLEAQRRRHPPERRRIPVGGPTRSDRGGTGHDLRDRTVPGSTLTMSVKR